MISRVRGEHEWQGRWRLPPPCVPVRTSEPALGLPPLELSRDQREGECEPGLRWESVAAVARSRAGWRWAWRLAGVILIVVAISVGYVAVDWLLDQFAPESAPARAVAIVLPASPRAWLDAYEAGAIDSPGKVCSQLLSPGLARAYGQTVHGSCTRYFGRPDSASLSIRRVFSEGSTAVLELRQTLNHVDWAVVLTRRHNGWQAVDVLAAGRWR